MKREWKDIPGFEGKYRVSNLGEVEVRKVLKPRLTETGYCRVILNDGNKRKEFYVHRLVAKLFLENNDGLPVVNHKDGDKENNSVSNLEWCSYSENELHKIYVLNTGRAKPVRCVETGKEYPSIARASEAVGCSTSGMSKAIKSGWRCRGYHWEYM